jgi:hypothetical protein
LDDNDHDLSYILKALNALHTKFYEQIDDQVKNPDVCSILPLIKLEVLLDVHIVFSGVIPLGQDPRHNELWIMATQFGAKCYTEVNPSITHLVAKKVFSIDLGRNCKSQIGTRNGISLDCKSGLVN